MFLLCPRLYHDAKAFEALLQFCDFPFLRVLATLSRQSRSRVCHEMERRVVARLLAFFGLADIPGFIDMLYDNGACLFGHIAQEVAAPGSGAALAPRRPGAIYCDSQMDLNIMVHSMESMRRCLLWLLTKRYIFWSGMHLFNGRFTTKTDYVVGYTRESNSKVRLLLRLEFISAV